MDLPCTPTICIYYQDHTYLDWDADNNEEEISGRQTRQEEIGCAFHSPIPGDSEDDEGVTREADKHGDTVDNQCCQQFQPIECGNGLLNGVVVVVVVIGCADDRTVDETTVDCSRQGCGERRYQILSQCTAPATGKDSCQLQPLALTASLHQGSSRTSPTAFIRNVL